MSNTYRVLTRTLLKYDLRDWSTLIFTYLFPAGMLIALVLSMRDLIPGVDITGAISVNMFAFGASFVGIYAGATHLALWRANGMFQVLRSFPLRAPTVLTAQATAGIVLLLGQVLLLMIIAVVLGMEPVAAAPAALLPLILGYLLFFFIGVLLGIWLPSMAGVSIAATAIIMPLGVLGGAMMPLETMPEWVQNIAPYTPIYHLREAISMPLIDDGTWSDCFKGVAYLAGFTVVIGFLAQRLMLFK